MKKKRPQAPAAVPALERGLTILESIAHAKEPMGFNSLAKVIGVSQTTMARIIHVLVERGYVLKDEERRKYLPGPRMATTLGLRESPIDQFRTQARPVLQRLVEVTHNTALALFFSNGNVQCVAKQTHPDSIAMQEVGTISSNLSITPWGWILYGVLSHELRFQSLKQMAEPERFMKEIDRHLRQLAEIGYVCDAGHHRPDIVRLAAPVFSNGVCIGALAIGGTLASLPDSKTAGFGITLREQADTLTRKLSA